MIETNNQINNYFNLIFKHKIKDPTKFNVYLEKLCTASKSSTWHQKQKQTVTSSTFLLHNEIAKSSMKVAICLSIFAVLYETA